jgi:hypothetical protein
MIPQIGRTNHLLLRLGGLSPCMAHVEPPKEHEEQDDKDEPDDCTHEFLSDVGE